MAAGGVITASLAEIAQHAGIKHPNKRPFHDISFVGVAWNEVERTPELLALAREWFSHLVIGVQESTDGTLSAVRQFANRPSDQIIEHPHYGYGDRSMPELVRAVETPWVFVVAFDELPDLELLQGLESAVTWGDKMGYDAFWVPFHSIVEGVEYNEQHGHIRLFKQKLEWPTTLHSRVTGHKEIWWPHGHIVHDRSLDEMIRDYLRYYELGRGNRGWEAHNILMMHDACVGVAGKHGWTYVMHYDWWKRVSKLAFTKEELDGIGSQP